MRGPSLRHRSEQTDRISVLLPADRSQQLRALAARLGIKVSPLVKDMIIKALDLHFGLTAEHPKDQPAAVGQGLKDHPFGIDGDS